MSTLTLWMIPLYALKFAALGLSLLALVWLIELLREHAAVGREIDEDRGP